MKYFWLSMGASLGMVAVSSGSQLKWIPYITAAVCMFLLWTNFRSRVVEQRRRNTNRQSMAMGRTGKLGRVLLFPEDRRLRIRR